MERTFSLKAARNMAELTQAQVAGLMDVTVETIRSWEKGKSYPNALQIAKLVDIYNVTYDELIFV